MLEAGEDARFIARRLVILASEDVGDGRPAGARRGRRPRPTPSSTSACPRPSSTWPRPSSTWPPPPSRTGSALGIWARPGGRAPRPVGARCRCTSATPTTRARRSSGTGRATTILTTTPRAGCRSTTCPTRSPDRTYYEPSDHGFEQEIRTRMERRTEPMTATELAAVVVAVASVVGVVVLARVPRPDSTARVREVRRRRCSCSASRPSRSRRSAERQRRARAGRRPPRHGRVDRRHRRLRVAPRLPRPFSNPVIKALALAIGHRPGRHAASAARGRSGRSSRVPAPVLVVHRRRLRLRRLVLADALRRARRRPATRPSACPPTSPAPSRASAQDLRAAVAEGREAMREREAELRADVERAPQLTRQSAPSARRRAAGRLARTMDATGLRRAWDEFFVDRQHTLVPSASLIPHAPHRARCSRTRG